MHLRRRALIQFAALAILACAPPAAKPESASARTPIDSLVLERTVCFGFCPAYRLRISSTEEIRFESHNRGDSARVAADTAPRGTYDTLVKRADAIGFFALPPEIAKDSALCPRFATDLPTVIVGIFSAPSAKQVTDYHGCSPTTDATTLEPLKKLRAFEDEIDSTLRSSRWVRPNRPAK